MIDIFSNVISLLKAYSSFVLFSLNSDARSRSIVVPGFNCLCPIYFAAVTDGKNFGKPFNQFLCLWARESQTELFHEISSKKSEKRTLCSLAMAALR